MGWNYFGTVEESYATGDASGEDALVGGLVGLNERGTLKDSYATGNVDGDELVGGLVGENGGAVENSHYNIDEVLINGENHLTVGGIYDEQYKDWMENKELDPDNYDSLELVDDYYEVSNVQSIRDLLGFADVEEYRFRLTNDIDLSDETDLFIPYLAAEFDGDGHVFSNFSLDKDFAGHIGVFGQVNGGTVLNMEVIDADVSGASDVGGLVGQNYYGNVKNSYATGVVSGKAFVGGLVAFNYEGTLEDSYATVDASGDHLVGGLVGINQGEIDNSYASGDVNGDNFIGGLVGENSREIENSYATGNVIGEELVGGLVGVNERGTVTNSYASGNVDGDEFVGGLVAANSADSTIYNTYTTSEVSGEEWVGNLLGSNEGTLSDSFSLDPPLIGGEFGELQGRVTDADESEMKDTPLYTQTSYSDYDDLHEPWDFFDDPNDDEGDVDIWDIDEEINDGYPFFRWEIESLLRINAVGEGTVEVDDKEVTELPYEERYEDGTEIDIKAIPDDGWYFEEWTGDVESSDKEITVTVDENKEIIANFEIVTHNATLEVEGEGKITVETYDEEEDEWIEPPFSPIEHTWGPEPIPEGTQTRLTVEPAEDWYFDEWTGDVPNGENGEEITVTMDQDRHIKAHFTEEEPDVYYTLEVTAEEGGTVDVEIEGETTTLEEGTESWDIEEGTTATLTAEADEDWYFFEWLELEDGEPIDVYSGEPQIEVTMDKDITLEALFAETRLILDIKGDGQVVVEGRFEDDEQWLEFEESPIRDEFTTYIMDEDLEFRLTAEADDDWEFDEWQGTDEMGEMITITMDEDKEITAIFEKEDDEPYMYDLKIAVEGQGFTEPEEGTHTYDEGEKVTIEAIPDDGWYFEEWMGDEQSSDREITVTMDEDMTLTANFEEVKEDDVVLTIEVEGEGSTDPEAGDHIYEEGEEVTIEATPDDGYEFEEWTGDFESEEKEISILMDENKEVTAHFEEVIERYDLTFVVEDEDGESIEGATVEMDDMEETTDSDGEAVFEDLEPSTYEYEITHDDYETEDDEVEIEDQDETVTVSMEDEEDDDTPGFTSMILILGIIIAVAIYQKKKQ